jgi:hypothetical protein
MPDAAARLSAAGRADHRCTAGSVAARPSNGLGWPRGQLYQLRGELAEASGDMLDVLGPLSPSDDRSAPAWWMTIWPHEQTGPGGWRHECLTGGGVPEDGRRSRQMMAVVPDSSSRG